MYRIFLDTNVAFDLVANREPFVQDSRAFLALVDEGDAQLFISELSLGTLIYLAFEKYKLDGANDKLTGFVEFCQVISGGKGAFKSSMNSNFKDKEDGLQYYTALDNKMDFLITRDKNDFKNADGKMPILSPLEFFGR